MQTLKSSIFKALGYLAHSVYLDEAVINTDLQKNVMMVLTDTWAKPADELTTETDVPLFWKLVVGLHGFIVLLMAWKLWKPPTFLWTVHGDQGPGPEVRHRHDWITLLLGLCLSRGNSLSLSSLTITYHDLKKKKKKTFYMGKIVFLLRNWRGGFLADLAGSSQS